MIIIKIITNNNDKCNNTNNTIRKIAMAIINK